MFCWGYGRTVNVVHVDVVKLCLWTAATNKPIDYHPGDEYGKTRWKDIDREKLLIRLPELFEKF
jgi:hypothetical protein